MSKYDYILDEWNRREVTKDLFEKVDDLYQQTVDQCQGVYYEVLVQSRASGLTQPFLVNMDSIEQDAEEEAKTSLKNPSHPLQERLSKIHRMLEDNDKLSKTADMNLVALRVLYEGEQYHVSLVKRRQAPEPESESEYDSSEYSSSEYDSFESSECDSSDSDSPEYDPSQYESPEYDSSECESLEYGSSQYDSSEYESPQYESQPEYESVVYSSLEEESEYSYYESSSEESHIFQQFQHKRMFESDSEEDCELENRSKRHCQRDYEDYEFTATRYNEDGGYYSCSHDKTPQE